MATPTQLQAVLHRLSIPLSAVMQLQAGDLMPLPMASVEKLRLEGSGGRRLVMGRLGQARGFRAVKLSLGDAADLAQSIGGVHDPDIAAE